DRRVTRPDARPTVGFRVRPAVGIRLLGSGCAALALTVTLEVVRRGIPTVDIPAVVVAEWVFALVFAVVAGWGAWLLVRGPRLVLTPDGFRNHTNGRRDSVRAARWVEVSDVRRGDTPAGVVLVAALTDGRHSVIATRLLDVGVAVLEEQIRSRLNDAHGYSPLS
ncbi:MAG TPA: hypothetical protein VE287_09155, partial [Actinopolymorphaceae bacterium]|nr:hypothetical protein [Actinopolymorphaceae bacterium]